MRSKPIPIARAELQQGDTVSTLDDIEDLEDLVGASGGQLLHLKRNVFVGKKRRKAGRSPRPPPQTEEMREASREQMRAYHEDAPHRGEGNPMAKLTKAQADAMLEEMRAGATSKAVAQKYGVSLFTASLIRQGKHWSQR